jgi:hypothetical protein
MSWWQTARVVCGSEGAPQTLPSSICRAEIRQAAGLIPVFKLDLRRRPPKETFVKRGDRYKKLQFDPHADAWLRGDARGRNGSLPQKLAAGPARWLAARHRRPSGSISSAAEGSTTRSISTADVLSSVDQLGQFLSGIEHTCFYSRGWHVGNPRYFVDRLGFQPSGKPLSRYF